MDGCDGWMGWMDGSPGEVKYRAPYGANNQTLTILSRSLYAHYKSFPKIRYSDIYNKCLDDQIFAMRFGITGQTFRYLLNGSRPPFRAVLPIESWFTRTLEGVGKAGASVLTVPTKKYNVGNFLMIPSNN